VSWRDTFGPLARTVETVFPADRDLDALLAAKRPLRVKFGIDLTSTQVTIGNEIPLRIMGRFQQMGHTAVLILGDFTTLVGDPSGRDKTRPVLSPGDVERNGTTWLAQLGTLLDLSRAEVRRNSEWLGKLTTEEVLRLTGQLTVAQMLERESFAKRYAEGTPIHLHEFLYCLLQGHDSVVVKADIELGGSDQTFNLNVGRALQKNAGMAPQVCVINPLLEGVDGSAKMSKSLGNAIGVDTPAKDMFGLATRVPDALVGKYLRLATDLPDAAIDALLRGNIWDAKKTMAEALVARHWGEQEARGARGEFERVFRDRERPAEMPEYVVTCLGSVPSGHLVRDAFGLSGAEARRLVEQGSAAMNGTALTDPLLPVDPRDGDILNVGKRRWVVIRRR